MFSARLPFTCRLSVSIFFNLDRQVLPASGQVSIGNLNLILSGAELSGSRPMPAGLQQEPKGVEPGIVAGARFACPLADLKKAGVHFRNEMEAGPGGKQVQIEDPDGNAIELFEPARC